LQFKILIIDDSVAIINSIIDTLENENPDYSFLQATNGEIGVEVARKYLPDIIITDWEMPVLNGIATIQKLKADPKTKQIPVIMLTGKMTDSQSLKTAFEAGAIDFIRKPIDSIELKARVHSMLLYAFSIRKMIETKNNELNQMSLNAIQHNELIGRIIKRLIEIELNFGYKNKKLSQQISKLRQELDETIKRTENWERFTDYFNTVYPEFTKKLLQKHPKLTSHETQICIYIRMGLSSKDLSSLLYIELTSVKSLRWRIRQKLNLQQTDNLQSYLMVL